MGLNQTSAGKNQTGVNGPPPPTNPAIAFPQKISTPRSSCIQRSHRSRHAQNDLNGTLRPSAGS